MQGGFVIHIDPAKFELFATASLSFGIGDAQVNYGSATGLLVVQTGADGRNPGVAGMLQVSQLRGHRHPDFGTLFKAEGTVSVMFNTTKQDQTFVIPTGLRRRCSSPATRRRSRLRRGAGARRPAQPERARPAARSTSAASIARRSTIGGVIDLFGFIGSPPRPQQRPGAT